MILVLGVNGYLGSLLCSANVDNLPHILGVPNLSKILYSLSREQLIDYGLKPKEVSTVVVAASKPKLEKWSLRDFESNLNIVKGVTKHFQDSRVIFLSTVDIYGNSPDLPLNESSEQAGNSLYAKSKIQSEEVLMENFSSDRLLILRLPGVYGGSHKAHGLFDLFVRCCRKNKPVVLDSVDVLDVKRDWVYGPDIIDFLIRNTLNEQFMGGVFNFVCGRSVTIKEWILCAEELTGSTATIVFREPQIHHEIFDLRFDASRLTNAFPALTYTPIEKSIIL
jgi:nucleoside-diphosphate-sugar epimerase